MHSLSLGTPTLNLPSLIVGMDFAEPDAEAPDDAFEDPMDVEVPMIPKYEVTESLGRMPVSTPFDVQWMQVADT